jgi:AraC family transcriptional regulator, arabinose operon regulatory protein
MFSGRCEMIHISAFTRDFDLSNYKDDVNYITVNCSGYYRNNSGNKYQCNRDRGRMDYLLMYCAEGSEYVTFEGKEERLEQGWISLHRPGVPQYLHYNLDSSTLYWVHFTGFGCEELLQSCGLTESKVYFTGKNSEIESVFLRLIDEIMVKGEGYERICSTLMTYSLLLIGRGIKKADHGLKEESRQTILDAISYINSNYFKRITVDSLAARSYINKYAFIRQFKTFSGYTPIDYIIRVRMQKAKEIFERPGISVKTTASEVGYDNPFYFSRLFKKTQGISPENYLRQRKLK